MKKLSAFAIAAGLLTAGAAFAQQPQAPLPAHSSGSTHLQTPGASQGMPAAGQFNPGGNTGNASGSAPGAATTSTTAPANSAMPATNSDMTRSTTSASDSTYTAPRGNDRPRQRRWNRAPRADRG